MSDTISFVLNGERVEIPATDPTRTVLDFLREERGLTGTKEGCREGDCGACTVAVVSLIDGRPSVRAANACILFLPSLHGTAIYTVEGIALAGGGAHPVQEALVNCHASQCGFCTPGFVMSLYAADLAGEPGERPRIEEVLAGNLCRCTGYGPILDAAEQSLDGVVDPKGDLASAGGQVSSIDDGRALRFEYDCPLGGERRSYFAPRSLDDFAAAIKRKPDAVILAGGTDLALLVTKRQTRFRDVIDIGKIDELRAASVSEDEIEIGATATIAETRRILRAHFPGLDPLLSRFGSLQIRSRGTIGGNIANGSPIGDLPPALIALGARIVLVGPDGERALPLEKFYIDYGQQDRAQGELLTRIVIPRPSSDVRFNTYKISKRFEQDISSVCGAFHLRLVDGIAMDVRVAFGGMAGIPKRAVSAEAALEGERFGASELDDAIEALADDFEPMSDHRASARYRLLVAQNLLRKFHASVTEQPTAQLELGVTG